METVVRIPNREALPEENKKEINDVKEDDMNRGWKSKTICIPEEENNINGIKAMIKLI